MNQLAYQPITESEMAKHLMGLRLKMINYTINKYKLSEEAAEDLVSEIAYKALKFREQFNPAKGKISTFLFRILNNTFIDSVRGYKPKFQQNSIIPNEYIGKEGTTLMYDGVVEQESIDAKFECNVVIKAIEMLPEKLAGVLRLVAEGKNYDEISKELEIPLTLVKGRVNLGRMRLAKSLVASGLMDAHRMGRAAYMVDGGHRIISDKTIRKHALQIAKLAQEELFG